MAILPSNEPSRVRRWVQATILVAICASFALAQGMTPRELSPPRPVMGHFDALAFSYGQEGTTVAWLLLALLSITNLGLITEPLGRFESAGQLALAGATLATVAASNAFTLGVAWGLTDLVLIVLKLRDADQEEPHHLTRYGTGNLLSTMTLTVAVVLMGGQDTPSPNYAFASLTRASLPWLALATFLRLGAYPLPHRNSGMWEVELASLCTGIYPWLQLGTIHSLSFVWLPTAIIAPSLLVMGLLASRTADFASAWPYIGMYGVLLSLLPMLMGGDGSVAATLSLVVVWALCVGLRQVYIRASVPQSIAPWWRGPMIVALAALSHLPPTLGFAAHWSLLRLCWENGRWDVILAVSAASLLIAMPLWRQLDTLLAFQADYEELEWPKRITLGAATLLAAALMIAGVCSGCLGRIWSGRAAALSPFSGGFKREGVLLFLTLIPPLGGYALHRLVSIFPSPLVPWGEGLDFLMNRDWLYGSVEIASERVNAWIARLYTIIEESLGLGWILVWALALILYLVGR